MFQSLEFALKIYISGAYKVIKNSLPPDFVFEYSYKDIENFPLEKLLSIFKKLSGNHDLRERIGKTLKVRNELAHRALIYRHEVVRDLLSVNVETHELNLSDMENLLNGCLEDMAEEMEMMVKKIPSNEVDG